MATRALVLGGGGVTGIAWQLGMLTGLAEAGVDLRDADLVVGTSAGAVVAAKISSGLDLQELYRRQLRDPGWEQADGVSAAAFARMVRNVVRGDDARVIRARFAKMALSARTVPEDQRRRILESRLPSAEWPSRRLLLTAVDVESGEDVVFDRDSGVPLVDAVAASCAIPGVWPPATIGGRRYMDGGVRSAVNADLAAGHDRVVVLAPLMRGGGPLPSPGAQVRELERTAQVALVRPDRRAQRAIGRNVLDPAHRAPAALAGREQAISVLDEVARVWTEVARVAEE